MNDIELEKLLRDSRPVVKDDPAFMLEVQQRLETVEGIKNEVDRQRRHSHSALVITLCIGLAAGIMATVFVMLFPLERTKSQLADILTSLAPWKPYLAIATAIAVSLLSIYIGDNSTLIINKIHILHPSKTDGGDCLTH